MQAPPVEQRGYDEIVAETTALAERFTATAGAAGWRPAPDGRPDGGTALIAVFGRFAERVIDRLNRAPEKSYLAFLNLIGTSMLPPQPARVPLTFLLAPGSPVDAAVAAGAQVAAPPLEGEADEVLFETERDLVVHRASLRAAQVVDTDADAWADRFAQASGQAADPFGVFSADQPRPHRLYLACDPALTQPEPKDVTITFRTADTRPWQTWPVSWWWWDGADWQPAQASGAAAAGAWMVTLRGLPPVTARTLGGTEAAWLRAQLELRLPTGRRDLQPESMAVGAGRPQGFAVPVEPFPAASSQARFYLSAGDAFSRAGARVHLQIRLGRPGAAAPDGVRLDWSYSLGDNVWRVIGQSGADAELVGGSDFDLRDGTRAFTRDGEISFQVPAGWPSVLYYSRTGRWLRATVSAGSYVTPPQVAGLELTQEWLPPSVERISVRVGAGPQTPPSGCLTENDLSLVDRTQAAAAGPAFTPFEPAPDTEPALYLGYDLPFATRPVTLYLQVEPPRPEEVAADRLAAAGPAGSAHVTWEYEGADGWRPLGAADETQELSGRGLVQFIGPGNQAAHTRFGQELYWLRARWQRGEFPLPPRLRGVLLNTTWAAQVATVADEILGSGNGDLGQGFTTSQTPVQPGQRLLVRERELPSPAERQALEAEEGADAVTVTVDAAGQPEEIWVRWHAVADFYGSGPRDRHYTVDALSGQIRFGDGVAGMVVPPGQNNLRITYRTGGGQQGNRDAGTIVQLKAGIPFVERAVNPETAQGGAPREPIERLKERSPRALRHRDRAIAAQDLEDLATAASPQVAKVAAIVPSFSPYSLWIEPGGRPTADHDAVEAGRAGVIVVPDAPDARPTPSLGLLRTVKAHLERRCSPTVDLWVAGPEWIEVAVVATVAAVSVEAADALAGRVRAALDGFIHPLTGGPAGQGWPFGRTPRRSDLFALLEAVEGVQSVPALEVWLRPETADPDLRLRLGALLGRSLRQRGNHPELDADLWRWLDRALVYPGRHQVTNVLL
jgi:hypothetical protein